MTSLNRDLDVVIVGSGGAGLVAAITAHETGAERVLVAEAEGVVGGSSRLSSGLVMGAGTRYQTALGIEDSGEAFFHDYMQLNRWNVDVAIVRRLCELSGAVVDWFGDLGVEFHEELEMGFDEITPRAHVPIGKGQRIIDVLHRECRERGIDIALGQRVDRLLVEDGEVCGVAVGGDEITAHAVVLASGGFGASDKKLKEFFPSAAATGRAWYIGADGSRGDAVDLAAQVDAQFIGHDRGLRLLDTGFDRVLEALVPSWMMLVDHDGRRFINEGAPYGLLDFAVRERGDSAFVIFDHGTLHGEAGQGHFEPVRPGNVRAPSPHWNPDTVEMMLAAGQVKSAETIAGLADQLGLSPSTLTGSVERYNVCVEVGEDLHFAKSPGSLFRVGTAPFYGAELRPATVCSTAYGPRITPDAQVLGSDDRPIVGLYAAGECTGGVVGAQYVGSGNNYANCTVVGHIAGAAAANAVLTQG